MATIPTEKLKKLRATFNEDEIEKLPKYVGQKDANGKIPKSAYGTCPECGRRHPLPAIHLDYVGHAGITERLNDVDPEWNWEPVAFDEAGLPRYDRNGGLWIKLTVLGVTRYGYGDAQGKQGPNAVKETIGDAIRNAAMRFGVATYLWSKSEKAEHMKEFDEPPAPIKDDDGNSGKSPTKESLIGCIQSMKASAIDAGADEGEINGWYKERFGGAAMNKLKVSELEELQTHLFEVAKSSGLEVPIK